MAYFSNDPFEQEEHAIEFFEKLKAQMQEDISRIRDILLGDSNELEEKYKKLPADQKKIYDEFIDFYSKCPVCKGDNHREDLLKFLFDDLDSSVRLKEKLLSLMKSNIDLTKQIEIGIPCCDCFKKYFGD